MATKVRKWGNSLAIRIPSSTAESLSIEEGSDVEIYAENEMLIVKPKKAKPDLEDLLSKITSENRHTEVDFGEPEGKELL